MSKFNVSDEIKQAVMDELGYSETNDEEINRRVNRYIQEGMGVLNRTAGTAIDYAEDDLAMSLLKTYCRYANSHALEHFKDNNLSELQSLNFDYNVKGFQQNDGS